MRPTIAVWILALIATIWFLREARSLLIPLAFGILISSALEPIVCWLERGGLNRVIGASLLMLAILVAAAAAVYALSDDAVEVMRAAPSAMERMRETVFSQVGVEGGADGRSPARRC